MTAIDLEAEYDNRARVPGHPAITAGWVSDAATFRERHGGHLDEPYGPAERMRMDLFGDPQGPVVVFLHGGYWQARDRKDFSHLAAGLAARGCLVALPSYDLCPTVTLATIVDEVRAACAHVWRRHGRPIAVAGHSAGGHLAACMLATDWPTVASDLPAHIVRSATCISGLFDLRPLVSTSVNTALGLDEREAQRLSPASWPAPRGLVLDAIVGGLESSEYLRQAALITETWGSAGVDTRREVAAGADHFTVIAPLADADSAMTRRLATLAAAAGTD